MQNILNALKNWYPTSVLPEPEFRSREAEYRRIEEHLAELAQIIERAKKNGAYLKAPNGNLTNLTEHQWALVRTKAFKQEFGDWERATQVAKLLKSEPIVASGEEWKGKYELDRHSATRYVLEALRGEYTNKDTGATVTVSRKSRKTTSHGGEVHLSTVALIPQMIENAIFLGEESNEKDKRGFANFRYYVTHIKIDTTDYLIRMTVGVDKNGEAYYDHALTQIKKRAASPDQRDLLDTQVYDWETTPSAFKDERLISLLQGDFSRSSSLVDENGETYYDHALTKIKKGELADQRDLLDTQVYGRRGPLSGHQDRRLLSLLQGDCSKFSNLVDENGEPKVAEVEAFEGKHADIQLQQLSWIKQDDKAFGWFNPTANAIVLCEGHNTSVAFEAFWHATFCLTKKNAPKLHNKMLMYAQNASKSIKYARKKLYPKLETDSYDWSDKLGAMRFVMEYARKIEKSLEPNIFLRAWRALGNDEVNLGKIAKLPSKKAVAALANAFARQLRWH